MENPTNLTTPLHEFYYNPLALSYTYDSPTAPTPPAEVSAFHASLPSFHPTPLVPHPSLASTLSLRHLYLKSETTRLSLPSFKILGATWATQRALTTLLSLPALTPLSTLGAAARAASITLVAATDGNHGRALAHAAGLLGLPATIFVPWRILPSTIAAIAGEGEHVRIVNVDGDYDAAVQEAVVEAREDGRVLVQDTYAYEGYDDVPRWIVEGYGTMLREVDEVLAAEGKVAGLIVVPVGVGSLANAVVAHYKSSAREKRPRILAVEAAAAPCLTRAMIGGWPVSVQTRDTIMTGLNCPTVSGSAWPLLKRGIDAVCTVGEWAAHQGVLELQGIGVDAGPVPGGCVGAVRALGHHGMKRMGLGRNSVVVILVTEGARPYEIPGPDT